MKIWITKYCLTSGIIECNAEDTGRYIVIIPKTKRREVFYYHDEGKYWFKKEDLAIRKAKEIKKNKLEFLKKQTKLLNEQMKTINYIRFGDGK